MGNFQPMNKADVQAALTARGITFDPSAKAAELKAALDKAILDGQNAPGVLTAPTPPASAPITEPDRADLDDIEVGDPQLLRPIELPLVVKPANGGDWKNDAQAIYATTLNGYAYRNPAKWARKKGTLIARLAEIGRNPDALAKYQADDGSLSFKDKRLQG